MCVQRRRPVSECPLELPPLQRGSDHSSQTPAVVEEEAPFKNT
jgi:hypothetical protein